MLIHSSQLVLEHAKLRELVTVETDAKGYWEINRLAPEMVRHLYGSASHPDYSRVDTPNSSRQPEFAQQLLEGTAVFRLPDGVVEATLRRYASPF